MKKTLATLALLFAGASLCLGFQPSTAYSAPDGTEGEESSTGNVCALVKNATATDTDTVLLTVEI